MINSSDSKIQKFTVLIYSRITDEETSLHMQSLKDLKNIFGLGPKDTDISGKLGLDDHLFQYAISFNDLYHTIDTVNDHYPTEL
jgi:hypothetical protein